MKFINITEEQRKELCDELAKLTFEFRKDKDIKCIYFAPYKGFGNITGNVLEITLVKGSNKDTVLEERLKEYNLSHQGHDFIRKFGFKILLDSDEERKYTTMDLNHSECIRSNNLMNSTILYDENGKFTQIKEKTTNVAKNNGKDTFYYYYDNLAEVFPPLNEELDSVLDMESDTKTTKTIAK